MKRRKTNIHTGWQPLFNNGFTLIELLAVIVILAIIALIAVPQILNIINDSKKRSAEISTENYLRAVELAVMNKDTDITEKNINGTYKINAKGKKLKSETNEIDVEFDGKSNFEGYITITNYKVTSTDIRVDDYSISYIDGKVFPSKKKEPEKSTLVTGLEFNTKIKSLVNGANITHSFVDRKVKSIEFYSNGLLPSGYTEQTLETLPKENVSTENEITAYNDNGKIYIVSDKLISFNSDSSYMFYNLELVNNIIFRNINTQLLKNMHCFFSECKNLISIDIDSLEIINVTQMSYLFKNCISLVNLNLNNWDVNSVKDMSSMFTGCSGLTNLNINNWNTSKVTSMSNMFSNCSSLKFLNVSNFDTISVTNMSYMFAGCSLLVNLDVSNFNTSQVTNMRGMFSSCDNLTILNLTNFDTNKVTTMVSMFSSCSLLKELNLINFDTDQVTDMKEMFKNTTNLQTITIGCDWVTSTNNTNMFSSSGYKQTQFDALVEEKQASCQTT